MQRVFARQLRGQMTDAERRLWYFLRRRNLGGYKFRRQQIIGRYIVDFVCLQKRLIVEVDGSQHVDQAPRDAQRTAWLESQGFRVIRFWNDEVLRETRSVCDEICRALGMDEVPPS
jgi:very-short-patch-repair endonuclease